jgi:hypothetical protein
MVLLQSIGGYEQKLARLFDSTNDSGLSFISSSSNYFVSSTTRVASEPSADAAPCNYAFDIGKQ